jgi:hypothetical protein
MPETHALTVILACASAIVLIANALEKLLALARGVRSPIEGTNARLDSLERWREEVERKLERDHDRLREIDESISVTQRAILALLDHGIDGNNVEGMRDAKEELNTHLTSRRRNI